MIFVNFLFIEPMDLQGETALDNYYQASIALVGYMSGKPKTPAVLDPQKII